MSYKLNKNLLFVALVSGFVLSSVKAQARGTVTLVLDEEDAAAERATLPTNNASSQNATDALITPPSKTPTTEVKIQKTSEDKVLAQKNEAFSLNLNAQDDLLAPATEKNVGAQAPVAPKATTDSLAPIAPTSATAPASNESGQNQAGSTAGAPLDPLPKSEPQFGETLLSTIDNDLFNKMSDIEKQTTLLTLELRREKLRNELEAVKEQRTKAYEEKLAAEEEKKRKQLEWEKEQEAKVLREQQALKEKEIVLERLKQKKALNEYMQHMLKQTQQWIAEKNNLYKRMREVEEDRRKITDDFKTKLESLKNLADKSVQTANEAKSAYDRTVANMTTQIAQLKKRLEAEELAAKNREQNPFAEGGNQGASNGANSGIDLEINPTSIATEYVILDITGKGENLSAKLINKDGQSFQVRVGTVLQTGHTVEKIDKSYILFDKNGLKDYLYTAVTATNVEPTAFVETPKSELISEAKLKAAKKTKQDPSKKKELLSTKGIPSLGSGMFVK